METILITGNMGYVGPRVVAHLRSSYPGVKNKGFDTGYFAANLVDNLLPEHLLDEQTFGDVRDITPALFEGVDAVVHLSAISNDPMGNAYERVTRDINLDATLEECAPPARPECAILFSPLPAVYTALPTMAPVTKNQP